MPFVAISRYLYRVSEIEIVTPRGVVLRGSFTAPSDNTNSAVLFSHPFFADRFGGLFFSEIAEAYRNAGYATLLFDYSGHGSSGNESIEVRSQMEDLRAASGWLAEQGFTRQVLHGHSSGVLAPMRARPPAVRTMVLTSPITGPINYDWDKIFSPSQLEDIERRGYASVRDDSPGAREEFILTKETLKDLSLNQPEALIDDFEYPLMLIHDQDDLRHGLADLTIEYQDRLFPGSHVEILEEIRFQDAADVVTVMAVDWAKDQVPLQS